MTDEKNALFLKCSRKLTQFLRSYQPNKLYGDFIQQGNIILTEIFFNQIFLGYFLYNATKISTYISKEIVEFTPMQNQVYRKWKIVLYLFTWKAVTVLSLLLGSGNKFTWRCGIKSYRSWRIWCSRTQGPSLCFGPRGWSKILSKPIRSSAYSRNWDGSQYRYLRNGAIIATHELCALQLKKKKNFANLP